MNEQEALDRMLKPGARKAGKWMSGVIQIWVTRACDKACLHCTQGSNFAGNPGMISLDNFERACKSLKSYHGVVGMFGGNPAMHPKFEELCEILASHIPYERRGIWCNNPLGKAAKMREIFNPRYSNINVHLDRAAYEEFRRDWPECSPVGLNSDSRHSPVFAALSDMSDTNEGQRWQLISECDINHHWSGMFGQFRGELRFWFCEVAGAQSMLHQGQPDYPDTGLKVDAVDGRECWNLSMNSYATQVRKHCLECGVPMRGRGELSQSPNGVEQISNVHESVCHPKRSDRLVQLVTSSHEINAQELRSVVDYIGNGKS